VKEWPFDYTDKEIIEAIRAGGILELICDVCGRQHHTHHDLAQCCEPTMRRVRFLGTDEPRA